MKTLISDDLKSGSCYGARHTQVLLLFALTTLGYALRVVLSVSIVAMTDPNTSSNRNIPTYEWKNGSVILSSFFWGYILTQIVAGQAAKYYGPKRFLLTVMPVTSVISILVPILAQYGSSVIIVCRILQGLAQGFICPSCYHLLSKWAPPSERSRFISFVYAGGPFGTVITLPLTGWICGSSYGWPFAFYLYGGLGLLWCVLWFLLGSNSPKEHNSISALEQNYIETSLNQVHDEKPMATPWKSIFTSLPFWAIMIAASGQNWGYSTLLTQSPTYMDSVHRFQIESNGLLCAGPYLLYWILSFIFGSLADWTVTRTSVGVLNVRRIANSLGTVVPAIALITLGLIVSTSNDNTTETLVLLFIAVGVSSSSTSGFHANSMDIGPTHAGTLIGLSNTFSHISSILGPLTVQFIVTEPENPYQWATIFYISAVVLIIGNLFFVLYGSGTVQTWNYENKRRPQIRSANIVYDIHKEDKEEV